MAKAYVRRLSKLGTIYFSKLQFSQSRFDFMFYLLEQANEARIGRLVITRPIPAPGSAAIIY